MEDTHSYGTILRHTAKHLTLKMSSMSDLKAVGTYRPSIQSQTMCTKFSEPPTLSRTRVQSSGGRLGSGSLVVIVRTVDDIVMEKA